MKRKMIAMLLVTSLLGSLFVGCTPKEEKTVTTPETPVVENKKEEPKAPVVDEKAKAIQDQIDKLGGDTGGLTLPLVDKPVTISLNIESEYPDIDNSWLVKKIEELTNIKLEVIEMPNASIVEKVKLTVASGEMYDIMYGVDTRQVNTLGMQGAFAPINKLVEEYDLPNFKRIFIEENPWFLPQLSAEDGNLYFWPMYNVQRDVNHGYMYRADIFEEIGIKPWTNHEEFYENLKALKEAYPESYPFASKNGATQLKNFAYSWGSQVPYKFVEEKNTWEFGAIMPEYKEMLDFVQKMYKEGLIDPEFLTDTAASWTTKMTTNASFVTYDWIDRMDMFRQQVAETIPNYDLRYGYPVGPTGMHFPLAKVGTSGRQVNAKSKNLEAVAKFLDFASSPAGAELFTVGMEGEVYTKQADGKKIYNGFESDHVMTINDLLSKFGIFGMGMYTSVSPNSVYFTYSERQQEAQELLTKNNRLMNPSPILTFTTSEDDLKSEVAADLETKALEFSSKYITDPSYGDKEWNEWVQRAKKELKVEELTAAYNNAQSRLDAKSK